MPFKNSVIFLLLCIICSCEEELNIGTRIEGKVVCKTSEVDVSKADNIVITDNVAPVLWKGSYTDTSVKINYTKKAGTDGETETFTFVFNKKEDCLQIDYGYQYYYGSFTDISAVTKIQIFDLKLNEW